MSELEKFFGAASRLTDETLDKLIPNSEIPPQRLHEAMRWSLFAGGKRFRPALVLAVGGIFGAPNEKLLRAAAAVEMIHTYSLIHDDLPAMDDDKLRRGRATCHVKFDESTAILAGDRLQVLAFEAIAGDENLSAETRVRLVAELAQAAGKMANGQQLDLEAEGKNISLADLEPIHENKTGAMICVSARLGAIIAQANNTELQAVSKYAAALGLLFQITDDLLDVTQTTEVLGKTAGKDERANKATYVSLYGLSESLKLAQKVYAQALEALKIIDRETGILQELVDFILHRKK